MTRSYESIFIKPTVDSDSGRGVISFHKQPGGSFFTSDGKTKLTVEFLNEYGTNQKDFILQAGLSQTEYISQFNPTSINTIRVCTYRSVKDNKVHATAAILRIGKKGSEIDNAHAGGLFVGIYPDGTLANYLCDQYGNRYHEFNGIDFQTTKFKIPDFPELLKFAESVGERIIHHRIVAHDICIDADGNFKLVEFNLRGFAPWVFQFSIGPAFDGYTDEIIEYCAKHRKDALKVYTELA